MTKHISQENKRQSNKVNDIKMLGKVVQNANMTKNAVKNDDLEVKKRPKSQKMTKKKTFENPAPPIRLQKILKA